MVHASRQLLVVLDRSAADEAQAAVRRHFEVSDVGSPRLLVVLDDGRQAAIRSVPGVEAVIDEEIPEWLSTSLDEGELLFARAWLSRRVAAPEHRSGEGMSWDAPGFTPPDPPR